MERFSIHSNITALRKIICFCLFLPFVALLQAQNYVITFTASGAASTLDSVYVENITQSEHITLAGTDTLYLFGPTGNIHFQDEHSGMLVFPNPSIGYVNILLKSNSQNNCVFQLFDNLGRLLFIQNKKLCIGYNRFFINGLGNGIYFLKVLFSDHQYVEKIFSEQNFSNNNFIQLTTYYDGEGGSIEILKLKSSKNISFMPYNDGEILYLKGYSLNYKRVISLLPTESQAIDFNFIPCQGIDGNSYAVITIGAQTWMADNMMYLPSVNSFDSISNSKPYFYVYGYNGTNVSTAKNTTNYTTYGVMYNWVAAMNGGSGSDLNPSGVQGICPDGWHLPSDAEWKQLEMYIGMSQIQADSIGYRGTNQGSMIAGNAILWTDGVLDNNSAFGITGFNALPGGTINNEYLGERCFWWSCTENNPGFVRYRGLFNVFSKIQRQSASKALPYYVRCVKD